MTIHEQLTKKSLKNSNNENSSDNGSKELVWEEVKSSFAPISALITALTLLIGVTISIMEHKEKAKIDKALIQAQKIEIDVKLVESFTNLMNIAHGRGGYNVSDKAAEIKKQIFDRYDSELVTKIDIDDLALVSYPVGTAAQDAAIAGIAELAMKNGVLQSMGLQGLESLYLNLHAKRPVIAPHLIRLKIELGMKDPYDLTYLYNVSAYQSYLEKNNQKK